MHLNLSVGSWVARRARTSPDRVALSFGQERLTYGQLDERVTRLARAFEARGIRRGDRIAFLGHNHPAALETLFACGLLGAVAVLVHPGLDETALAEVLTRIEPGALVVTPELAPLVARVDAARRVPLRSSTGIVADDAERFEDLIRSASDEPIDRPVGLDDVGLIALSSGTTGPRKGVQLTHGNILFNALNTLTCLDYLHDDVILSSAPLSRMGGLGFTLALLLKGGTSVIQGQPGAELTLRLIEEHRVTIVFDSVDALSAVHAAASRAPADLSSLRLCLTGGSPVPPALIEAFRSLGLRLQSGYGLSEAAPLALLLDRDHVDDHPGAAGSPPLFTSVRIVDGDLEDVAPGEVGELLVSGPQVMAGYWRDPEATARTLVGGWLRTGDAATTRDGITTIVGRIADALTIGGRRVHPGPVEQALAGEAGVRECAIVQTAPNTRPVLFYVPSHEAALDHHQVLGMCRHDLGAPDPAIVPVSALPKNQNGKVLRAELTRSWARHDMSHRACSPRGCGQPAETS